MKKSLLCSVLFLLLFGSILKAQVYQDPKNMEAVKTSGAITVDGLLNEPALGSADEYLIFGPNAPTTAFIKSVTGSALVQAPYTDTCLLYTSPSPRDRTRS